jgi:hypothetical protein
VRYFGKSTSWGKLAGEAPSSVAFFLIVLIFLPAVAFLRVVALVTGVFLRFALPCL